MVVVVWSGRWQWEELNECQGRITEKSKIGYSIWFLEEKRKTLRTYNSVQRNLFWEVMKLIIVINASSTTSINLIWKNRKWTRSGQRDPLRTVVIYIHTTGMVIWTICGILFEGLSRMHASILRKNRRRPVSPEWIGPKTKVLRKVISSTDPYTPRFYLILERLFNSWNYL